jgi:hypothetical protein
MNNRKKNHELWVSYFVRRLQEKGYDIKEPGLRNENFFGDSTCISGDGEVSDIWLKTGIQTNKGNVNLNRMITFEGDIYSCSKKELYELKLVGPSDFFDIEEGDKNRYFSFYVDPNNRVEITDHSSRLNPLRYPEASWRDFPLIDKYKNRKTGNPRELVEDVIKYIDVVGVPSDKQESAADKKNNSQVGLSLGLKLNT